MMLERKSMIQTAYDLMKKKKKPISFDRLWTETSQLLGLSEEEADEYIAEFYTELTLDGRIVTLGENVWDLRERNTFDKVHIDMNDVYAEDEEESEEEVSEDSEAEVEETEDADDDSDEEESEY